MKKILLVLFVFVLSGCAERKIINNYSLEKYNGSEVPVCVNRPKLVKVVDVGGVKYDSNRQMITDSCGIAVKFPPKYEELKSECEALPTTVVSYSYCLSELPKPVHLVEKKVGDMTICYDRNNKVELPILYCQKDMVNIQTTDVTTNVIQQTKVSNKTVFNW
ncbi:MAG: hypothetical protein II238_01810 [Alphaproteobacteria bacterium]|nr:hypothetical protein [Alphaproteobacteria bacterium]